MGASPSTRPTPPPRRAASRAPRRPVQLDSEDDNATLTRTPTKATMTDGGVTKATGGGVGLLGRGQEAGAIGAGTLRTTEVACAGACALHARVACGFGERRVVTVVDSGRLWYSTPYGLVFRLA